MQDQNTITAKRHLGLLMIGIGMTVFGLMLFIPGAFDPERDSVLGAAGSLLFGPFLVHSYFRPLQITLQPDRLRMRVTFGSLELAWGDVDRFVLLDDGKLAVMFRNEQPPKGWERFGKHAKGATIPGVWTQSGVELATLLTPYWAAATGRPAEAPRRLNELATAEAREAEQAKPFTSQRLAPKLRLAVTILMIPFGMMSLPALGMLTAPFGSTMATVGAVLLFVVGLPFIGLLLLRGRMPTLVVEREGFSLRSLSLGKRRLDWREVGPFKADGRAVRFSFARGTPEDDFWRKRLDGGEVRLKGGWSLEGEALASLLNDRRAAALAG